MYPTWTRCTLIWPLEDDKLQCIVPQWPELSCKRRLFEQSARWGRQTGLYTERLTPLFEWSWFLLKKKLHNLYLSYIELRKNYLEYWKAMKFLHQYNQCSIKWRRIFCQLESRWNWKESILLKCFFSFWGGEDKYIKNFVHNITCLEFKLAWLRY